MSEPISQERLVELLKLAKGLTTEEFQVLYAAFGFCIMQEVQQQMVQDEPEEYRGQNVIYGTTMISPALSMMDDTTSDSDIERAIVKYKLGRFFDLILERTVVAKPRPL